ncbi:MAG: aminoglycoside phosphotransferase family protein [Acidobacteria bacterium]|nr:aminoglycoside phosphotransferase family protein [Acidobacteriota bacterium]
MVGTEALQEKVRNRLLRRADWRFLLHNPQPRKSICFANGLLSQAVGLISDCVVDAEGDLPGDCDLAVAIDPDDTTLRAAWDSLHPGGSCYTEWYSPLAGRREGIRRRLEAAGFEDVTCYWCWPWPFLSRSRYWVPLEAPGALHYFLISRPPARNAIRRIGVAILRVIWLLCFRIGFTLPVCAAARKRAFLSSPQQPSAVGPALPASSRTLVASVTPHLLSTIRAQWTSWGFGPTSDHLSLLILTGGPRSICKVVALVFAEPNHQPSLAVKMPRVPEAVAGLAREATTLQAIESLRPGGVRGAPRVLFYQEHAGLFTVGETAFAGQPLFTLIRRSNYRDLALKATDWLCDLASHAEPHPPPAWWDRLVEPVLTGFGESFGPIIDSDMLRETRDIVATLGALPLVCEQRDFAPWNILVTAEGELAVLDWESSALRGLPAMDLIYFLAYLGFFLDGAIISGRFRESYRKMLDSSTLTGRVMRECLALYADRMGLNSVNLRALRLLVWMLHSGSEYQHFRSDAGGKPEPETLRRSLFVNLWEEELHHGPGGL